MSELAIVCEKLPKNHVYQKFVLFMKRKQKKINPKKKYEYFFIFFALLVDNMKICSYTIDCKIKKQDEWGICEILLNMALFMGFL